MNRSAVAVAGLGAVVVAFGVIVAIAVVFAGVGRDQFGGASPSTVTAALTDRGLVVCSAGEPDRVSGQSGAVSRQQIVVATRATGCGEGLTVQLDAYNNAAHRDAAARAAEGNLRPRAFGTVYTWRQFTIYMQADDASADSTTRDLVVKALDSIGAN